MMEITQLSRPQASPAKTSEARPDKSVAEGQSSAEFDQHLQQQMDQSRSAESAEENPTSEIKTKENQKLVDNSVELSEDLSEQVQEPEQALPVDELLALPAEQPVAGVESEAQPAMSPELEPITDDRLEMLAGEQNLPPHGNHLPPVAAGSQVFTEQPVTSGQQTSEQQSKAVEGPGPRSQPVVTTPTPQPLAAAASPALADDNMEFVLPELKMTVKNNQAGESKNALPVTAKTSLNMASIASAASSLQQVPLTTSTAAMHNQGSALPALDNFMASTPTLSSTLNTPVQNPAWSQGVAERVAWMVQGNFQSAELKLNPSNLGPLEIKLTVHDDNKATIHFVTSHAAVRDALDAAMPRLREMLESQGLDMADVNVSDSGVQGNEAQAGEDQQGGAVAGQKGAGDGTGETLVQESIMRVDVQDGVSIYA